MAQCTHFDLVEFGQPLQANTRSLPGLKGREVLCEVLGAGVCHSDLHMIEGEFDLGDEGVMRMSDRGMKLPRTLGHETVGRVIKVGPQGDQSLLGKNMLVFPWLGCGECRVCAEGRTNDCMKMQIIGLVHNGGYASHIHLENSDNLVDVTGLDPIMVASHACSGLTVFNALGRLGPPNPDTWLAILGAGGLGLNAIAIAKALGFRNIVAVDINKNSLDAAVKMGATHVLDSTSKNAIEELRTLTGNELTDVLDTVGAPQTARLAVNALIKSGRYVVVGLFGGDFKMPQPWLAQKAMTVQGCHVGTLEQLQSLIALVRGGKIKEMPVETRPMSEINSALDDLRNGQVTGRIVLQPDQHF